MRFISWNVNGLRACVNKGFLDTFHQLDADFFCLQETKLQQGQIDLDLPGYEQYWCYAQKKGYSGTAIFTRHTPLSVSYGLGIEELDTEGRLITLEYQEFYLVTCYTPNAQRGLARIDHRLRWEDAFLAYLKDLDSRKPVIVCGDLNVAHQEIDLKNPASNRGNAGFSDEERAAFSRLLDNGFTDTFRHLYPDKTGAYSWWSYMFNARQNNAGWRIDYFLVSDRLKDSIFEAAIHPEFLGSDHCPVGLDLSTTCNGSIWAAHTPQCEDTTAPEGSKKDGSEKPSFSDYFRMGINLAACAMAAFLILSPLLFAKRTPTPPTPLQESTTAPTVAEPPILITQQLIHDIIDRSGTLERLSYAGSPTDSTIKEFFTNGHEKWTLYGFSSAIPPLNSSDSDNFHLQIVFTPEIQFSSSEKPVIMVIDDSASSLETEGAASIQTRYYLNEDGNIAGCFIYGTIIDTAKLVITSKYQNIVCTTTSIIKPPSNYNTHELVNHIQFSGMLLDAMTSSVPNATRTLIDTNPFIQELLRRPDAVQELLRINQLGFIGATRILLNNPDFKAIMTDEERTALAALYDEWHAGGDILYGYLTSEAPPPLVHP